VWVVLGYKKRKLVFTVCPLFFRGHTLFLRGHPQTFGGHPLLSSGHPLLFGGHPLFFRGHPHLFGGQPQIARGQTKSSQEIQFINKNCYFASINQPKKYKNEEVGFDDNGSVFFCEWVEGANWT